MPYRLDWELPHGVVKIFYGEISGQELLESVIAVEGSPHFDRLRYVLNDFRACTGLSLAAEEAEEMTAIDRGAAITNSAIVIAIVAEDPGLLAAARDYADAPLNPYPTRVFTQMEAARQWLNWRLTR